MDYFFYFIVCDMRNGIDEELSLLLRFSSFDAYMLNDLMKLKLERKTKSNRKKTEVMTKVANIALMFTVQSFATV